MTIPRTTAKKLSTDVEFRLVNESFAPAIGTLTAKGIAARITRARAARDKQRTLAERQNREARGRVAARSTRPAESNQNTIKKQQMFDETLARYEKRAAQLAASSDETGSTGKKAATSARKSATKAGAKTTAPKTAAKTSKRAKGAMATKKAEPRTAKKSAIKKGAAKKSATKKTAAKNGVAIPSLQRVVSKVAKAVTKLKEQAAEATTASPARSSKAPASADGASTTRTRKKVVVNPKGPEYPRNAHERGRVGSVQRRQQARRDGR